MQQCESPSPYAQRRAYAGRPALKCFVKRGVTSLGIVWWLRMICKENTLKLHQGIMKFILRDGGSNPRGRGHSNQIRFPFKTQMQRLQTENHHYVEQLHKVKMEVAEWSFKYSTGGNKVSSP